MDNTVKTALPTSRKRDSLWPTRIQSPSDKYERRSHAGVITARPLVALARQGSSWIAPVVVTVTAPTSGSDSTSASTSATPAPYGTPIDSPKYVSVKAGPVWFWAEATFAKTSTT